MLARALWKQGRLQPALAALEAPLQREPKAAPLWVVRALVLIDLEQREAALAAADRAVALAPRDFEAHQARQKALAALGQLREAMREIDVARGLTDDPAEQRALMRQQRILRSMMAAAGMEPAGASAPAPAPDSAVTP
jgi:tetratricopeptide (TPR) repeat protein